MNKNSQNRYALAETAKTPSPFPPTIHVGGIDMPFTASIRRKARKLVAEGMVKREDLPLSPSVNNATFSWMRPLLASQIKGTYTGIPFNVGSNAAPVSTVAPVIVPTVQPVAKVEDPSAENAAARKVVKRKTVTPKVEATVTKPKAAPKTPKTTTSASKAKNLIKI